MSEITTERGVKKAFFTDLAGGKLLEFQFSPSTMEFSEGGSYENRIPVGNYFNELVWISGKPAKFDLRMFIDRTQESFTSDEYNKDPFQGIQQFPNSNPKYTSFDIANLIIGLSNNTSSSGFASSFKGKSTDKANKVAPSNYSASPHYQQGGSADESGVIQDLEALLYFVRPVGLNLGEITIQKDGTVRTLDLPQGRFTPPPMCRYYFGNIWREGYITEVKYELSVVDKNLIPKRMDAIITMACSRWGYLTELTSKGSAIDIMDTPTGGLIA